MRTFSKSTKLDNVLYDVRGPVVDEAARMEDEGERILKLNIGNPAPFGFRTPDEVIKDMRQQLPDLVLMDIMMPGIDGLEATRRIRALDRDDAATTPIIAVSANAFADDRRLSREAGMNAHLSKPVSSQELVEALAHIAADAL